MIAITTPAITINRLMDEPLSLGASLPARLPTTSAGGSSGCVWVIVPPRVSVQQHGDTRPTSLGASKIVAGSL
jgi:hypothetical protein